MAPQCGGWAGEQLHCLMGMDVPDPWCWGTPVAVLEELGGDIFHLPWALVPLQRCGDGSWLGWWLRWGWQEEGQGVIWTPPATSVPLCSSLSVQSSFLSHYLTIVLLECMAKSLFFSSSCFFSNKQFSNYLSDGETFPLGEIHIKILSGNVSSWPVLIVFVVKICTLWKYLNSI